MSAPKSPPTNVLRTLAIQLAIWIATFAIVEMALRVADPRVLREGQSERTIAYRHDAELGWAPVPDSEFTVIAERLGGPGDEPTPTSA